VQCGAEIAGSAKEARRRATEVLAQVGLAERLQHYPSELSGGRVVSDGPPAGGRASISDLRW
jgi:predicted ABC-type transport system involved in lysophospholipase L1 biosynthesis ATPase subunit